MKILSPAPIWSALILGLSALTLNAQPELGKAADNKIYAQTLVNELAGQHHELLIIGLHAIAPGAKEPSMIASTLDRIGKKDGDDDISVGTGRKIIVTFYPTEPDKFAVQLPMKDAAGQVIGMALFVIKSQAGEDDAAIYLKTRGFRDGLAKKIPNLAALFAPIK